MGVVKKKQKNPGRISFILTSGSPYILKLIKARHLCFQIHKITKWGDEQIDRHDYCPSSTPPCGQPVYLFVFYRNTPCMGGAGLVSQASSGYAAVELDK